MKLPVHLIVPEHGSDLCYPYIVDADGIVVVSKCTAADGRIIIEALNKLAVDSVCEFCKNTRTTNICD